MGPQSATLTNVSASASSVTLLNAAGHARGRTIHNDSSSALYVKFGTAASSTSFTVKLAGDAFYEFPQPCYSGVVTGVWASATGTARVTEW
ncbi:hypothetical protein OR263_25600 [Streptomyces sp. NEAU-H22]|uniref:hypothetical protein n=1 Tax=Streptomyces sp. NEAU-H22 TaxID=2994655 RepID=UPI0022585C36|nr:hypothetical protein [Streptomyces sp. NEAU-H22]MCX3290046.1 hypothetical protein [Streptomyces sp. NEAU-H22]